MAAIDFDTLQLSRYPSKHAKELRAWDAADEYLAQFIPTDARVLLINDGFGALHCAAERNQAAAIVHINDSWCSLRAIDLNHRRIAPELYRGQPFDVALIKLPKSLSMLEAQLVQLAATLQTPTRLYFSGMQKHVSNGHLELLRRYCEPLAYLPTQRKARMYCAQLLPAKHAAVATLLDVPELGLQLHNQPGVFSEHKLDIGSRFFISQFDQLPSAKTVADVGCGNGLLSLAYHQLHPAAQLYLYDESMAAVLSAQASFAHNFPATQVTVTHHDGLVDVAQQFELILINPPFHQQNTVTTDLALAMFEQAQQCLAPDGELWIVANRHLNYVTPLRKLFKDVSCAAQNAKFVILRARQARPAAS
jgi:23S rRNA (guanine1835-N2)-methyltransferase